MSTEHTVLLIQFDGSDAHSRTYLDFDTLNDSMDAISQMYENKLRQEGKTVEKGNEDLEYGMRDLVKFLDESIADLTCLVFDEVQKIYIPHGKDWIKSRLYCYLKKYATKLEEPAE